MKYTALTIGPIIKSLSLARRTKELWAASFFFAFLMEEVINSIENKDTIILPYTDKRKLIAKNRIDQKKIKSAGIFPDRLFLQSENGMYNELEIAVEKAIDKAVEQFEIDSYFIDVKKYLNTHIVEFEYIERKEKEGQDNIIFQASDFMATCELQANYSAADRSVFLKMLEKIDQAKIYKDVFDNGKNFPSIIEISTKGLELEENFFKINLKEEDNIIWNKIVEFSKNEKKKIFEKLKTSHKYIAIVQADGDNISKIITNVAKSGNKKDLLDFSEALSTFSLLTAEKIVGYGGTPVYVGGDDLLFFAPVANSEKHIFKLIEDIDNIFNDTVTSKYPIVKPQPSMSYGVSISYYKHPMHEALLAAQNLLFEKAKRTDNKNAIAFKVLKHSGQIFEAILSKPLHPEFINMLNEDHGLVINSIIYNFEKHKTILKEVIGNKEMLHNFFTNFYNEDVHKKAEGFICSVEQLIFDTYYLNDKEKKLLNNETFEEQKERNFTKTINQIYVQLRLIKFLNAKNNE